MMDPELKAELETLRREVEGLKQRRRRSRAWLLAAALLVGGVVLAQPTITPFTENMPARASEVNGNFTQLAAWSVPRNAIVLFDGACPTGYSEMTNLRGRFVVGAPSTTTGTQFGTALGTNDDRPWTHAHTGNTGGLTSYQQGEVNYVVDIGRQTPWQMRQALVMDTVTVRTSDIAPFVYMRYCRKN